MGVRTYTASMQLTSTLPATFTNRVVIDWATFAQNVVDQYDSHDIDSLIDWVKNHPRRRSIHVVLKRERTVDSRVHVLQKSLQALGCTVSTRMQLTRDRQLAPITNFAHTEWR